MSVPNVKDVKTPELVLPAVYNKPDGTLVMNGKEVTDEKALLALGDQLDDEGNIVRRGEFTVERVDGKLVATKRKPRPTTTTIRFLMSGGMNSKPHAVGEVRTVPTAEADTYLATGAAELYAERVVQKPKPVATIKRAVRDE